MYGFFKRALRLGRGALIILLGAILGLMMSCEKSEGPGGSASIGGSIVEHFYNDDFSLKLDSMPAIDEEVFILFGNEDVPGDRVNTGPAGDFRFDYLYPGTYQVYFRSLDPSTVPEEEQWQIHQVDLEKGEVFDLGSLEKSSILEFDEGRGSIGGVLKKTKYVNGSVWPNLVPEYVDFAREHEVYLTYGDHSFYDERVRSQHDGYFEFSGLIPGNYTIFLYSEDVTETSEHVVLTFVVTLKDMDEHHDLGEISIEEL